MRDVDGKALASSSQVREQSAPFVEASCPIQAPVPPNANEREAVPAPLYGVITLPPPHGLSCRGVIETLSKQHLSAEEIERLLGVSHAGVLGALDRFGISRNGNWRNRTGQPPLGFEAKALGADGIINVRIDSVDESVHGTIPAIEWIFGYTETYSSIATVLAFKL